MVRHEQRSNIRHSVAAMPGRAMCVCIVALWVLWYRPVNFSRPMGPIEIYRGVWYSCKQIDAGEEGRGLAHIVQVDLSAPGIELYVTPLDPEAMRAGAQYKLAFALGVASTQQLAVVINGTQFKTHSLLPLPGSLADSNETLVSDRQASHVHEHSYLLWFDESLRPTLERTKPPRPEALMQAHWGISGVSVAMRNGRPRSYSSGTAGRPVVDARSIIGFDAAEKRLWLAVFEQASARVAIQTLADLGATEAIRVDGGDSSTMVIGSHAARIDPGIMMGGRRPVATFFGIRALPLADN